MDNRRLPAEPKAVEQDTWQDTAKEQPYLMPGTSEYRERQEDLQLHDPFEPVNDMHKELRDHNVEIQEVRREQVNVVKPTVSERKYQLQMQKRARMAALQKEATQRAAQTEATDDNVRARQLPKAAEKMVQNDGVSVDDFLPKALKKFDL